MSAAFWAKVERGGPDDCWLWTGGVGSHGYGGAQIDKRNTTAHRHAYALLVGAIPAGLVLDHLCRNRLCVNPAHLEPVTNRENSRRSPIHHANQTHCKRGHPFDSANTCPRTDGKGLRRCRACHRDEERARLARLKPKPTIHTAPIEERTDLK